MAGSGSGYVVALTYGGLSTTTYAGSEAGLAAAIAALGSSGGELKLGPGTYSLTTGLTINGPIRIIGSGWNTILQCSAATMTALTFGSGSAGSEVTALRINGGVATATAQYGISATQRVRIQNVKFSGTDGTHGFSQQVILGVGSDGSIVTDCEFERVMGTTGAYSVWLEGVANCRVTNCFFTSTEGLHGVYLHGASTVAAAYNLVANCQFTGYVNSHIRIFGTNATYPARFNTVRSCISSSATMSSGTSSGAIQIGSATSAGNTTYTYLNRIEGCTVTGSGANGLQVQDSRDNTISDCLVQGSAKHGLALNATLAMRVKDVLIYDPSTATANTYDGVNIAAVGTDLSSGLLLENVQVLKSTLYATAYRYAFNYVTSGGTEASRMEFRDCQGTTGTSGVFNNIPLDARYVMARTDDYAAGTAYTHRLGGQLTLETPSGASSTNILTGGTGVSSFHVDTSANISTTGSFQTSAATALDISYAGTSLIKTTDAAGEINICNTSAGAATGLVLNTDNSVSVGTSTPSGYKFRVSGTANVTGLALVGGNLTTSGSLRADNKLQLGVGQTTEASNNTTVAVTTANILLANPGATTVAAFSGSINEGETLYLVASNGNTTIANNAAIKLSGAANYAMGTNDTLTLRYTNSLWIEVGRGNV